jgi:hypothetical protein
MLWIALIHNVLRVDSRFDTAGISHARTLPFWPRQETLESLSRRKVDARTRPVLTSVANSRRLSGSSRPTDLSDAGRIPSAITETRHFAACVG